MARPESRLDRVRRELERRARVELLRGLGGLFVGVAAAVLSTMLRPPVSYAMVLAVYTLGYLGMVYAARGGWLQGLLSYTGGFILTWFSVYAALIG